jgi:hypothetical protein
MRVLVACLATALSFPSGWTVAVTPLFDGESLAGWEGSREMWTVRDGAIVGGAPEQRVPETDYLCTVSEFGDFELRVTARMRRNGGVSFRAQRVAGSNHVGGYQVDMGAIRGREVARLSSVAVADSDARFETWGSLVDEFRPEPGRYPDPTQPFRFLVVADRAVISKALRPDDGNDVTVTARGARIRIGLNDRTTVDFVEAGAVPRQGRICLQIHRGPPGEVHYSNIAIEPL